MKRDINAISIQEKEINFSVNVKNRNSFTPE